MKELLYEGLGFPIRLKGVKTQEFRGEILPDINHRQLEDMVFKALLWAPMRLSGARLAFIRGYMKISQKGFADLLGMKSHATVSGWENKGNKVPSMPTGLEVAIRMLMADYIRDDSFPREFRKFFEVREKTKELRLKVA